MLKSLISQSWQQLRQNPFYSAVSIIGTGVTLAFAMTVYIVYDMATADIAPEIYRSRMIYSGEARSNSNDGSQVNSGMSDRTARAIAGDLPSAERVGFFTYNRPYSCEAVGTQGYKGRMRGRFVDAAWWKLFDYEFTAGHPFTDEESQAGRPVAVITDRMARLLFQTDDAVGREISVQFEPYTVVGVVKNVSSQFTEAAADFWLNYAKDKEGSWGSENVAGLTCFMVLPKRGQGRQAQTELAANIKRFNDNLRETELKVKIENHTTHAFQNNQLGMSPALLAVLLIGILLIVPALNISGLVSSMLEKRYGEIGIRKAYGASRAVVMRQFLSENMLLVVIGGAFGLALSFVGLYLFRFWLLGLSPSDTAAQPWWALFRPSVFAVAFAGCVVFNMLSTFLPVWMCTRKQIVESLNA